MPNLQNFKMMSGPLDLSLPNSLCYPQLTYAFSPQTLTASASRPNEFSRQLCIHAYKTLIALSAKVLNAQEIFLRDLDCIKWLWRHFLKASAMKFMRGLHNSASENGSGWTIVTEEVQETYCPFLGTNMWPPTAQLTHSISVLASDADTKTEHTHTHV